MYKIREIDHQDRAACKSFIQFPFGLYENDPYWVPPLIQDELQSLMNQPLHDAFDLKLWMVYSNNKPVGRIAGIINHKENEHSDQKTARFAHLDFINDQKVLQLLFAVCSDWAKTQGAELLKGPMGFTNLDKMGMLVEGFEQKPTIVELYNYAYYPKLMEGLGFVKAADWIAYEVLVPDDIPERIVRFAETIKKRYKLKVIRFKDSKDIIPYAKGFFHLLNETYKSLFGFIPIEEEQGSIYIKKYIKLIKPEYVSVILDRDETLLAFGIAMPSFSIAMQGARGALWPWGWWHLRKAMGANLRADLYLIGVHPKYQQKGLTAIIFNEIMSAFIRNGVQHVETNPELEDNIHVQKLWKAYETRFTKRRRVYQKHLLTNN